jgi:peptidoglycan/xylan/chitin deacetylase (PgdA/CDA1 family)
VVVPLHPVNPRGVYADGYQTVPILAYHRFGNKDGKMIVTPEAFATQMKFLADNGYRVVRLSELTDFLAGKRGLPSRAVVITIDDGFASIYEHAYPILKKHGFPATVFVYTDFIGARDALTWAQMREMIASGLVDIQSHSKSHESLAMPLAGESDAAYRKRLDNELKASREILQRNLPTRVSIFAYPYGDSSAIAVERVTKDDYQLAVTVNPGGNPFFAQPMLLQRTMIFGDHDIEAFKARLQTFRKADLQ